MRGRPTPATRILGTAVLAALSLLLGAAAQPDRLERWFEVRVGGRPAGWTRSLVERVPEGWRTESQTRLRLGRGGTMLDMTTGGWIVESEDGRPISGGRTQTGGGQAVRVTWTYGVDGVRERTIDGARVNEHLWPPLAQDALPPRAAETAAARLRGQGAAFEQTILEPTQGRLPQRVRVQPAGSATVKLPEGERQATCWQLSGPMVPKGTREWRDATDTLLRSLSPTGLGEIESVLSTEARAKATLDRAVSAPEIMVASFVKPDRPLQDPGQIRRVRLRLSAIEGTMEPVPSCGVQRAREAADGSVEVVVDLDATPVEATEPERRDPDYLAASPMIDGKDPRIASLAQQAVADADAGAVLERLRAAAHRALPRKNLSNALASASEALRTGSGDCTEHAVLLAAMLRARGIPARVVAGLVWCDAFAGERQVFGWHLWTQALVDGRWIDLDATLPAGGASFHAGHVALATTPLRDSASDPSWITLLASLGNLKVQVLEGGSD